MAIVEYWSDRRRQALRSARDAQSAELRALYRRIADHCRSLEQWCSTERPGAGPSVTCAVRGAVPDRG
jgi:hypothetical protein